MAAVTTIIAVASLVVAAGAAYVSYKQGQAAARDRKKANEVQTAENAARQQQDVRNQVRQDRIKRAQILQASQNSGVSLSSGSIGGQSSLSTQIGSNIGTITRQGNSSTAIGRFNQQAADAAGRSATFAQVSSLASSSFNFFAGTDSAKNDFQKWFGQ